MSSAPQPAGTGPALRPLVIGALGAALLVAAALESLRIGGASFLDLRVYRAAVAVWWSGGSPYGVDLLEGLRLNYPPSALPLLAPLAVGPTAFVGTALVVVGAACLVGVCRLLLPGAGWAGALLLAGASAQTEPFLTTWVYGQVDVLVLAAVVAGVVGLGRGPRPRPALPGVLLGAAAGLKLWPVVALLVPALQRRWRTVVAAAATVLGLTALAALRSPGVVRDWLAQAADGLVAVRPIDQDRVESWSGLLRALLGDGSRPLQVVVAVLVLVVATWVAVVRTRHDDAVGALAGLALGVVLASGITWTHHWVWWPVLAATVVRRGHRSVAQTVHLVAVALLGVAGLLWAPEWFALPDHGFAVSGGAWLASYSYVLLGSLCLATLAWTTVPAPAADRAPEVRDPVS